MIKFRAIPVIDEDDIKRLDSNYDGTFVYGHYVTAFPEYDYIIGDIIDDGEDFICPEWWVPVDPKTVEQFTGLKDVNGKDIYESDIVKSSYKYAQPKVSQISIEDGNSYILGEDLATGNEMLVSDHIGEIAVIGNVHTNPKLLEE